MTSAPGVTLLHLSDIHFGRKHRFEQEGLGSLLSRVCEDINERIARDGLRPDVVVLSGDFAEYGTIKEFEQASVFARGLRAHLSLPAHRFVLVPGNHDINWNKSRAYFEDREGDGLPAEEPYFPKFVHYKRFFDAFYEGEGGIAFTEEEPWSLFEMPDLGVVIAGLNSTFAESHRDTDHHAFLGERQLRAFAGKLKPYKERGFLRIGVMHHDPFDKRGGTKVDQDQRDLRRWLAPELNLLLHGDIHEETLQWLAGKGPVPVLGVGSAAVGVDERGADISNEYQLLVVRAGGIERHLRAWVSDQKRWVASPRADAVGESGKTSVPASFDAVTALGKQGAPAPEVDLAALVAQYRAAMARDQGAPTVFDLLGVGDSESAGGLDFLRLFVPQNAARDLPRPERFAQGRLDEVSSGEIVEARTPLPDLTARTRSVDKLFDGGRRLLFVGAPGAGKSALTRWLLLKLCVPGEHVEGLPDDLVPVRVELRRFDEEHRRANAAYSVFDHIAREQADRHGPLTAEHLRTLAGQGRVLWIFDGLDEIADPQRRRQMATRVAGLLDAHKDCRAVVTSRVAGVEVARPILEGAAFQTYALQDFTAEQRDRFLDAWHELVFRSDTRTGAQRRARMATAIDAAPSLQDLCKSPLLCSLLAYLHREESLPRRRHRLYQKVLERMAEHWDANKGLPPRPSAERFELEDKLAFLRVLAWKMQSEPRTAGNAIGRSELEDFTADFCESRWGQPKDVARRRGEALIHQLQVRNGVLTYLGADTYGFAHRAFLEHLAASEAVERFRRRQWELEDLAQAFVAHWRDAAWEETLLLMCGLLQEDGEPGSAQVVKLLQGIGEGKPAVIYASLDEYLVFCINALSELPQLEKGEAGDFARAINDILLTGLRRPSMSLMPHLTTVSSQPPVSVSTWKPKPWSLRLALRRCASRWPDVARMHRQTADASMPFEGWHSVWIGAGDRSARVQMIFEAFEHEQSVNSAVSDGASLGPWTDEELNALCDLAEKAGGDDQLYTYMSLIETSGMNWHGNERPIESIRMLMRTSPDIGIRQVCAWFLADRGYYAQEAVTLLREHMTSGIGKIQDEAALILATIGYIDETLPNIERNASEKAQYLYRICLMAKDSDAAAQAVVRVRAQIEQMAPREFVELVADVGDTALQLFSVDEIVKRFQAVTEPHPSRLIGRMGRLGSHAQLTLQLIQRLGPSMDEGDLLPALERMDVQQLEETLRQLFTRLLSSQNPIIVIYTSNHVLKNLNDLALRSQAYERLQSLLSSTQEHVRVTAAKSLGARDPKGLEVLSSSSVSSLQDDVRLFASIAAGDVRSLNDLSERAEWKERREQARHALDLYGEINAILQIGKLRRASVRFDGRDVGVLEELTKVGNGTRFRYNADYDGSPIAPNMPLGQTYEDTETLLPFFANLLPEGALYDQTARRLGLKRSDRLGVLLRVGTDTMGAIEIVPPEPA